MESLSSEKLEEIYETLQHINIGITRLQERTVQVHSFNDFLMSPWGMEKLDAASMVILAIGESVKSLDKLTNKQLLPTYPSIEWKKIMGARDIIAHHYFNIDAEAVFSIIKNDLAPLKTAIDFFINELFPQAKH